MPYGIPIVVGAVTSERVYNAYKKDGRNKNEKTKRKSDDAYLPATVKYLQLLGPKRGRKE